MYNLCFLSNLTSAEWAAWVQALGSIAAIVAAAGIAIHQAKLQHQNALNVHFTERRTAQVEVAKTLFVLANNASEAMKYISGILDNRDSVYFVAEGRTSCDIGEIHRINSYLNGIPLISVPYSLVTNTMNLGATVRQFEYEVKMALERHKQMDANMFANFFKRLTEMNTAMETICNSFSVEAKRLEAQNGEK
jgi:hypothetical protein